MLARSHEEARRLTEAAATDAEASGRRRERLAQERIAAAETAVITEMRHAAADLATLAAGRVMAEGWARRLRPRWWTRRSRGCHGRCGCLTAGMPETFGSFAEFIERFVIPCRAAHPEWRRLDGAQAGGNRSISAFVRHGDGVFRVHADCWIESLMAPYAASKQRPGEPSLAVVPREAERKRQQA